MERPLGNPQAANLPGEQPNGKTVALGDLTLLFANSPGMGRLDSFLCSG